jgi:hypothetical protein
MAVFDDLRAIGAAGGGLGLSLKVLEGAVVDRGLKVEMGMGDVVNFSPDVAAQLINDHVFLV